MTKRLRQASVAALGLILAACASGTWVKSVDSTYAGNLAAAQYECERDVRQSGYYGSGLIGVVNAQNFFGNCMTAKGFYFQAPDPAQ